MKKNYFSTLFAMLMLFLAMPATAQVSGMADLYGKYKFTATIETTEAGAAHADKFKSECDVTIVKDESGYHMAAITGFAGSPYEMAVSDFDAKTNTFVVNGPNSGYYGLWDGYIAVANTDGAWPFMIRKQNEEGEWVTVQEQYGMTFTVDPETKELTVPNFSIVTLDSYLAGDWNGTATTVLAQVSNVKLTLVEAYTVDTSKYPDLTGVWTWEGGLRTDTVSLKGFTVEFNMAEGGTKDKWDATFTFGDYDPFTLPATFDGSLVTIPYDSIYFDKEQGIRLGVRSSGTQRSGEFTFSYNLKTSMSLYSYIYVRKDVYSGDTLTGGKIYQVFDGYITREDPDAYDWSGVYKVSTPDFEDLDETDTITFPAEFDMVIEKKKGGLYEITEMLGYKDLYISLTPSDTDDKVAEIDLGGYSGAMLEFLGEVDGDYSYHVVTDAAGQPTTLTLTRNDDGTFSFADFSVSYKLFSAGTYEPLAAYWGATATKEVFDWAGDYTLTADVEAFTDTIECASSFGVQIENYNGTYYITQFDGNEVYSFNYGGIPLNVADNAKNASFNVGYFVGGGGSETANFITINGVDAATTIDLTMDARGNIQMGDFMFKSVNYSTNTNADVAKYSNVALTRKPAPTIALTAELDSIERTFEFASPVAGTKISIDWGDGNIVEAVTLTDAFDGWNEVEVKGSPVGRGNVKIYASDTLCYFDCVSVVNGAGITKLDVSNATELTELYANGNKLTSVDVSMLSKLEKLYLNNNSLTEVGLPTSLTYLQLASNQLTNFDGSGMTSLATLYLSDNQKLGTLDVSNLPALKSLYAMNCGLTSITVGELTTPKAYISVNNNLLETLDVSKATGLEGSSLLAMGNNLTEIKLPDVELKAVNISKNKFTLATIPATAKVKTLTYAPQQDMVIEDINGTIDLSAQNNLIGFAAEAQATVYTWCTEAGDTLVAGVDYTEEAGKFTFTKSQEQKVYCTMATAAFPKFTTANVFKTVAVAVSVEADGIDSVENSIELAGDIYTVDGKLVKRNANVTEMPKGLYIVKTAAGKAIKVIRK